MRKIFEAAVIFVGTLGWWGFIYPELSMVTESCAQVEEAEEQEENSFAAIGEKLGSTGISSGDFRIKSRIAEYLYQEKEKEKAKNEAKKESEYE